MSIQFDRQRLLEKIEEKKVTEMSATGGGVAGATFTSGEGEQSAPAKAFKKKSVEEDAPMLAHGKADISTYKKDKFKPVHRDTSKIKSIIVKDLWKEWEFKTGGVKAWDLGKILPQDMEKTLAKIVNTPGVTEKDLVDIRNRAQELYKDGRLTKDELNFYSNTSLNDFKEMFSEGSVNEDEYESTGTDMPKRDDDSAIDESLNEARGYNRFKKEAATRTKTQQMHEAAKMINKKLEEINRLLEYTNQMRSDLSEGEELMEYKSNTRKLFEKITAKVVETYSKVKKLK